MPVSNSGTAPQSQCQGNLGTKAATVFENAIIKESEKPVGLSNISFLHVVMASSKWKF